MKRAQELIPTRMSLLSRLKNWDDQESWRVVFETYWKLIYSAAIRAGLSDEEAQDVVQETVISVLKSMQDFNYRSVDGSFKSWLLRLTSWRINDQFRKRTRQIRGGLAHNDPTQTGTTDRIPDPNLDWQRTWDEDWESNLVQAAIHRVKNRVDPRHYQIFDLLVFKQWTPLRVANTFRTNRARIYLIKHRIAKLLKEEVHQLRKEAELINPGRQGTCPSGGRLFDPKAAPP